MTIMEARYGFGPTPKRDRFQRVSKEEFSAQTADRREDSEAGNNSEGKPESDLDRAVRALGEIRRKCNRWDSTNMIDEPRIQHIGEIATNALAEIQQGTILEPEVETAPKPTV